MVIAFIITGGLIAYLHRKTSKFIKREVVCSYERLKNEFDRDLKFILALPRGPYITLNGDEQLRMDSARDVIEMKREGYKEGNFDHLYSWIPESPEKNELRAKEYRIRNILERLTSH